MGPERGVEKTSGDVEPVSRGGRSDSVSQRVRIGVHYQSRYGISDARTVALVAL